MTEFSFFENDPFKINNTLPCTAIGLLYVYTLYVHFFKQVSFKNIIQWKTLQIFLMELLPESSMDHHLW